MATQQINERLAALTAAGTSIWLDQIGRQLIESGELRRLVEEDSLRGVTSNPTIFNQAVLGAPDYGDQLGAGPGTDEGTPAIEEMIYEGLNINVTLLFSVAAYERVAEAFIRGLERRLEEGKSVDMQSVASFFVSRVDTEVDKRLEAAGNTELVGRAGLANARMAYKAFQKVFGGERFAKLREA